MADAGVSLEDLDALLLTHLHLDHTGDVAPLLFALRNPDLHRQRPFRIVAPAAFSELRRGLLGVYGDWVADPPCGLEVEAWGEQPARLHGWEVIGRPVAHSAAAHGLRIRSPSGAVLACSGDADECEALVDLGRGADLLILECSHPDDRKVTGHLSPTPCGRIAASAGARRLLLTHFYPGWDPSDALPGVRRSFGGEIALAADGMRIDIDSQDLHP